MKYYIIATGFNCLPYAKKCYESLLKLDYKGEWEAWLLSDGSTDGTSEYLTSIVNDKITCLSFKTNMGAAKMRHDIINIIEPDDEDVIVFLGLDDELKPNALTVINRQYVVGKWMTYGNWVNQRGAGLPKDFKLEFDLTTHKNRDYRKVTYRSTAPNTFKYKLYKCITEEDLQINGKWIDSTTESEVMFSCLEQCGIQRIGVIKEPIYVYNQNLPNGTLKRLGHDYKYSIFEIVKNRPKRELYTG